MRQHQVYYSKCNACPANASAAVHQHALLLEGAPKFIRGLVLEMLLADKITAFHKHIYDCLQGAHIRHIPLGPAFEMDVAHEQTLLRHEICHS